MLCDDLDAWVVCLMKSDGRPGERGLPEYGQCRTKGEGSKNS